MHAPHRPPPTPRRDVVDVLHGETIVDPYRWLEDGESDEVRAWSEAQTAYAEARIEASPEYEAVRARVEALLRIGTVGAPFPVRRPDGSYRYFHQRQAPGEDQPVLYARESLDGPDRTLIDPNTMSGDGTTSIDWWLPSLDGSLLAYGISHGGDEESTLRVMDVASGKDLPSTEVISRARYASIAWLPDSTGFFYSRYPAKGTVPEGEERYHRLVYEHRIGRDPDRDPVVFGEGRALTDMTAVDLSPSGRWAVGAIHTGWSRREAWLLDRLGGSDVGGFAGQAGSRPQTPGARWIPLAIPEGDVIYDVLALDDELLIRTNEGAPTYRLFRVDPERPERSAWTEILAPCEDVLSSVIAVGETLVAAYIVHARSVVRRFSKRGEVLGEVALPTLGTVGVLSGLWCGREAFVHFTSFAVPALVLRVDVVTGETTTWAEVKPPMDASEFVVENRRAKSKDGTSVPMFVVHHKDRPCDGSGIAVLTGYGGFNLSQMPVWSGARYVLLERGGAVIVANLRGGGEYGASWHRAGMRENKQNVFDDAIAVAEHVLDAKLTSPERFAIVGGSNGGLLVGALVTQRPEMFRAAVCLVPLLDMLRYDRFLIAKLWVPEYGSASDPEQFRWLRAYSPYHHVRNDVRYPSMLFATAEADTRVDPLHARKMAARMQAIEHDGRPVLLRIESKAGHGAGKPISKRVDELSLIYAFLLDELKAE